MNPHENCNCRRCQMKAEGFSEEEIQEKQRAWEQDCMEKYGFWVHLVQDDESPTGINIHTHGLETYDHPDFQLIVPLPQQFAHSIVSDLANRVKNGERFSAEQNVDKVIKQWPVKLIDAEESGRKVLRIVLPDPDGKLERDEINDQYAIQYGIDRRPAWVPHKAKRSRR